MDGEILSIRPDAVFTLEVIGEPEPLRHFALEADRSSETHQVFRNTKLRLYWLGRTGYQNYLGVGSPVRVLSLCVSEQRAYNLAQEAGHEDIDPAGHGIA